jgi:hypothetical protein
MLLFNFLRIKKKLLWLSAADRIRTYDRLVSAFAYFERLFSVFDRLVNSQPLYRAKPRRHTVTLTHFQFNKTI